MKARRTHGLTSAGVTHPLYRLWAGMRARCSIASATHFAYYGGRGIRVCAEWNDVKVFAAWALANGWAHGLDIDRIDNDGHYEPGNCRFISPHENRRKSRRVHTTKAQADAARELMQSGLPVSAAARRAGITYMSAWHVKNSGVWL
jgi:hypothetical protein